MKAISTALELARFYCRIVPDRWYARFPFLPVPPRKYLQWRLRTAYGARRPGWGAVVGDVWEFGSWLCGLRSFENHPNRRGQP